MNTSMYKKIILIALFISIAALVLPGKTTIGVRFVENNTNLAPNVVGHPFGTGERIQNTTYWANNSPIQLMVFGHADTNGQHLALNLSINGTVVESTHLRPLAAAENTHAYITAIIPQYSNYSVNITNYHHYEWREYQILTGNVTTNITTSGTGTGCTVNCSFDRLYTNHLFKNTSSSSLFIEVDAMKFHSGNTIINSSDDNLPIYSYLTLNSLGKITTIDESSGDTSIISVSTSEAKFRHVNGSAQEFLLSVAGMSYTVDDNPILKANTGVANLTMNTTVYKWNQTHADYGMSNITNVNNTNTTGTINMTSINVSEKAALLDGRGSLLLYDNGTLRGQMSTNGIQEWFLRLSSGVNVGYIQYSTPSSSGINNPGIIFRNETQGRRTQINIDAGNGLRMTASANNSLNPTGINLLTNGTLRIERLASPGGGTDYVCVDETGMLFRQSAAC